MLLPRHFERAAIVQTSTASKSATPNRGCLMSRSTLARLVCAAAAALSGLAYAQAAANILTAGCADDLQKLCAGVQPGGGRIIACLKQHKDSLSAQCKQAAAQVSSQAAGAAPNPTPTLPTPTSTSSASEAANAVNAAPTATARPSSGTRAPAAKPAHAATVSSNAPSASAGTPGSYLLIRKVNVTGPGADAAQATQPAFDVMIPSTWKFVGNVVMGGGKGGCFADLFAVSMQATSPDGSTTFQTAPDYSWQYADDPSVMRSLNNPKRRALGAGGKPCPVAKPLKAEDYFRQNVLTLFPSGTTVVSVEPFPALNEIVRKRQGLPPGDGTTGPTRTEAIRARIAFQKDGKDLEEWVAVAMLVNISRAGRGSFYDSHATSLVALTAPKGKLDANDKLFKVIVSSIRPEPQWVTYANRQLTMLYQAEAQKEATIDKIYADLVRNEIAIIQGVTDNMMRGASVSAMQADQNIRNVQTFRDPTTGNTMELSNLYDHAWLNGSNEYVMSDDLNFNPNANLSGSWSQLQAVAPSP